VYTPLFAPIGVSIVVGLLRELANIIKKRKAAKKAAMEKKAADRLDNGTEVVSQGKTTAIDAPASARLRATTTTS
jgi:hypothetical protein